jgi:hypothetical protein
MDIKENGKELFVIILAAVILAISTSYRNQNLFYSTLISFIIILVINVSVKKFVGYIFETDVKTKFWLISQYGFRKDWRLIKPIPMIWLPPVLALFTNGFFYWLGILEFDVVAKTERVAKRHGLYRFTQVTEHHMGWIAMWALIINGVFAIGAYLLSFELFAKLSIYFMAWSIIPIGRLDGSKILFGGRAKWIITTTIVTILLILALTIP